MRTLILFILTSLFYQPFYANDGAYRSSGGIISPFKETRIALTKEFLAFTVRDKKAVVEVLFEFTNPDSEEKTLLVGFQAPAASGDVPDEISSVSQIMDFRVLHEGKLLPYSMKVADCEDCPLLDPSERYFTQFTEGVFVYLFELTFKPGVNRIQHSYEFPASGDVSTDQKYHYILRTGSKWAGSSIHEFTLQVDMGFNRYFYMSDIFGKNAEWSIVGTGKVFEEQFELFRPDMPTYRMAGTLAGKLMVTARDLSPEKDIEFGLFSEQIFFGNYNEDKSGLSGEFRVALSELTTESKREQSNPLTKEELSLLRNTIYAQHGYRFADKGLWEFFSRFAWYVPDPNLRMDQIRLSKAEQRFLAEILQKEKD